jgi:cell wall-associated NlpC family hydrolase
VLEKGAELLRSALRSAPKHLRSAPKHLAQSVGTQRTVTRLAAVAAAAALTLTVAVAVPPQADAGSGSSGTGSPVIAKRLRAKVMASKTLNAKRKLAVRVALFQRGDPYRYGGRGPHSFDCSGLTSYAWGRAGKRLPRTSSAQRAWTRNVGWRHKLPGDLLFYSGHAAMYVGFSSGRHWMMEAPHSGLRVRLIQARTRGLIKVGRVR